MAHDLSSPKVILITGASSGIGEALALRYAQDGVKLILSGRDAVRLESVASRCREFGADVDAQVINVTNREAMAAWIIAADEAQAIDLVIANAGISAGTGGVLHGEPPEQVRHVFDVNLNGVLNTIEPILPRMMARGFGQVAIMSSLAGFRGFPGAPAYGGSKAAVRVYGEALRGAVRACGVSVNVVCPGFVRSRMTAVNKFPMPFLMDVEKAAKIITKGLARDKSRISFPLPVVFSVWLLALLPDRVSQILLRLTPTKVQENC